MNIASFVLGLVSLLGSFFVPFLFIFTAIAGIILGILGLKKKEENRNLGIAGIVLSSIATVIAIVVIIIAVIVFAAAMAGGY